MQDHLKAENCVLKNMSEEQHMSTSTAKWVTIFDLTVIMWTKQLNILLNINVLDVLNLNVKTNVQMLMQCVFLCHSVAVFFFSVVTDLLIIGLKLVKLWKLSYDFSCETNIKIVM